MDDSQKPANDAEPAGHDPEIEKLLQFEPVSRRFKREDGWTAALQRKFIARLAMHGSPGKACAELGKHRSGLDKVYKAPGADSFRAAWAKAVELAETRSAERIAAANAATAGLKAPHVDNRRKVGGNAPSPQPLSRPGGGEGLMQREPLPVICDACSAKGIAGDEAFAAIPELLAFDPVPRRAHDRLWDAASQRAFIAALAVSGSPVRAARSVGRHAFGAEKLRKARGARGFNEAWEAALDVAREREMARLHGSLTELGEKIDARVADEEDDGGLGEREAEELREHLFNKLQRLRKRQLLAHKDDPQWRAAWEVINGPVDWAAIGDAAEGNESTEGKSIGGEADTSA